MVLFAQSIDLKLAPPQAPSATILRQTRRVKMLAD
jgi:hypothetical protein